MEATKDIIKRMEENNISGSDQVKKGYTFIIESQDPEKLRACRYCDEKTDNQWDCLKEHKFKTEAKECESAVRAHENAKLTYATTLLQESVRTAIERGLSSVEILYEVNEVLEHETLDGYEALSKK